MSENNQSPELCGLYAAREAVATTYQMYGGKRVGDDGDILIESASIPSPAIAINALSAALYAMAGAENQPHIADRLRRYADVVSKATWDADEKIKLPPPPKPSDE